MIEMQAAEFVGNPWHAEGVGLEKEYQVVPPTQVARREPEGWSME